MQISRWIRSCARCHSFLIPIDVLCESCWEFVESHFVYTQRRLQRNIRASFLTEWNSTDLGTLIHGLKGRGERIAWSRLARLFLRQTQFPNDRPSLIIPPSKDERVDHAYLFGSEISNLSGLSLVSPLRKRHHVEQKRLSKKERLELKFELCKKGLHEPFIFVDDVVTTGSTALAAWEALGRPQAFEVWAVACRPHQKLI